MAEGGHGEKGRVWVPVMEEEAICGKCKKKFVRRTDESWKVVCVRCWKISRGYMKPWEDKKAKRTWNQMKELEAVVEAEKKI